jgi:iron complex transport system ATP-binding protein
VITEEVVAEVFGMKAAVVSDPIAGAPMVVPMGRHHAVRNARSR